VKLVYEVITLLTFWIPGRLGIRVRRLVLRPFFEACGSGLTVGVGVRINSPGNITLGDEVWLDDYCSLVAGVALISDRYVTRKQTSSQVAEGKLIIGNGVHIASHCLLQAHMGIQIGNQCTVGAYSAVYTISNHYSTVGQSDNPDLVCKYTSLAPGAEQSLIVGSILLGNYCAVTPHCTLLSGAELGEGSWLLSYSLLRDRIEPYRFAKGIPAEDVGERPVG
jgi:acetyltransferase-like isoleucine patch superfamily enzyme